MGFHAEERRKARCPLFIHMVKSDQADIFGINCCEFYEGPDDRGSSWILRFEDMAKTLNWKRVYCDNALAYPMCKLYRAWQEFPEEIKRAEGE